MEIPLEGLTGTPDGQGPVITEGLLALHASYFRQIMNYDPSLSRFEIYRRAGEMVRGAIGKMVEAGFIEAPTDDTWEKYETLVRQGRRVFVIEMLKSPLRSAVSAARGLALRAAKKKAERLAAQGRSAKSGRGHGEE